MTAPIGSFGLNTAIFPNQLFTAYAGLFDGKSAAMFNMTQINLDRWITRVILQTTLTASDMIGGSTGAYWDLSANPPKQAPFYLFMGAPAVSNLVDLTLIGSVNVQEYFTPLKVPSGTELWGIWPGVLAASAMKCQATMMCAGVG